MITGKFPSLRLRRSRKNNWSRRLIEENNLTSNDFILPLFLIEGKNNTILDERKLNQTIEDNKVHVDYAIKFFR